MLDCCVKMVRPDHTRSKWSEVASANDTCDSRTNLLPGIGLRAKVEKSWVPIGTTIPGLRHVSIPSSLFFVSCKMHWERGRQSAQTHSHVVRPMAHSSLQIIQSGTANTAVCKRRIHCSQNTHSCGILGSGYDLSAVLHRVWVIGKRECSDQY